MNGARKLKESGQEIAKETQTETEAEASVASKRTGIGAAKGLAIGHAVVVHDFPAIPQSSISAAELSAERARLDAAIERARAELTTLIEGLSAELQAILSAQLLFLEDPELLSAIDARLIAGQGIEWAANESFEEVAQALASLDDAYLRERASDVRDLGMRIVAALMGLPTPGVHLQKPSILVAKDLTPSNTASLDQALVLGFVTELGGPTSHSAIMARAAGFPAVVGVDGLLSTVRDGDVLVVDANRGEIWVNPTAPTLAVYQHALEASLRERTRQKYQRNLPAATTDDHRVELVANIGGPKDVTAALDWGAEGVGLFRTEFLYMQNDALPTEEEQYQAYRVVAEQFAPRPVIYRTLDIGGDKNLPYLALPHEDNPFLGHRALRLCLERPELFKTQLRALLRASTQGNVRIMFPMVATLAEFRQAKCLLQEAAAKLHITQLPQVGIMVEIPSAAIMARAFAQEVDFFSIGSNDLIQYTVAADRGNKSVSYLYQNLEPAVLQLVAGVIDAAHATGKWVGMCGEMASDKQAIPILLGLGLDEFSMSAAALPEARELIRGLSYKDCQELAKRALAARDVAEVRALVAGDGASD